MLSALRNLLYAISLAGAPAYAGVDLVGPVQALEIAPDGTLWFRMDTTSASSYCTSGWLGMTLFIPANSPQYPYYFSVLAMAVSKAKLVQIGNISFYNGTTPCDVTKTGYGLAILQ